MQYLRRLTAFEHLACQSEQAADIAHIANAIRRGADPTKLVGCGVADPGLSLDNPGIFCGASFQLGIAH